MTLVAGLRAASYGVPFQPVGGVHGSDLARVNDWKTVRDPYGSGGPMGTQQAARVPQEPFGHIQRHHLPRVRSELTRRRL